MQKISVNQGQYKEPYFLAGPKSPFKTLWSTQLSSQEDSSLVFQNGGIKKYELVNVNYLTQLWGTNFCTPVSRFMQYTNYITRASINTRLTHFFTEFLNKHLLEEFQAGNLLHYSFDRNQVVESRWQNPKRYDMKTLITLPTFRFTSYLGRCGSFPQSNNYIMKVVQYQWTERILPPVGFEPPSSGMRTWNTTLRPTRKPPRYIYIPCFVESNKFS